MLIILVLLVICVCVWVSSCLMVRCGVLMIFVKIFIVYWFRFMGWFVCLKKCGRFFIFLGFCCIGML